jgi:hypothetical protein
MNLPLTISRSLHFSAPKAFSFGSWLTYVIRPQDVCPSAAAWGGGIEGLAAQLGARYDWRNL